MHFTPEQLTGGLIGLGLVAKGIIDHFAGRRSSAPACACQFSRQYFDKIMLEFERINMKLDK